MKTYRLSTATTDHCQGLDQGERLHLTGHLPWIPSQPRLGPALGKEIHEPEVTHLVPDDVGDPLAVR